MKSALAAVAGWLLAAVAVSAYEEIRFAQPSSLVAKYPDGVYNRPALFGIPPYGVAITGRVIYATPGDKDGCFPLNTSLVDSWPEAGETFIVMVDRGDCTFVTKVRNAQNVGAKAVIIVDNRDESDLPFMADDGTGATISVPSLLIKKEDGQNVKDAYPDGVVVATMKWGIPNPDGTVEWSFWTSSYDDNSVEFKNSFQVVMDTLGDTAPFEPHYFFLDGTVYGCDGSGGTACGNQCTNSGKYCAVDPEHDLNSGVSGADVVRENLRQVCIWRNVNATGNQDKWWKYINCFQQYCVEMSAFGGECSSECQNKFAIPVDLVSQCVSASGGTSDNGGENSLIKNEIKARADVGVYLLPSIIINNVPYHGSMNCPLPIQASSCNVFSTICSGYASGTQPDACKSSEGCGLGIVRDACGNCGGDGSVDACGNCLPKNHPDRRDDSSKCSDVYNSTKSSVSAASVVGIVFLMVTVVSLGFFYLHRRSQASMRRELADIMQQYVPLGNEEREDMQAVPSAVDTTGARRASGSGRQGSFS